MQSVSQVFDHTVLKQAKCCPYCGARAVLRTHKRSSEQLLQKVIPLKAYQCGNCHKRFIKTFDMWD